MLIEPSELQKAELRLEFRRVYRERGVAICLQAMYEMLKGAELMSEVILEERANERRDASGNA